MRNWKRRPAAKLSAAGLNASGKIILDDPGHGLIEEAETWEADCVFVGARGLNALERLLLGSVSSKVAGHAPCSVEVVRHPEKDVKIIIGELDLAAALV